MRPTLALFFVWLVVASAVRADTLLLKDGRKLEGQVLEETEAIVKFKMRGAVISFTKEEVVSVTKGEVPESAAGGSGAGTSGAVPRVDRSKPSGNAAVDEARKAWVAAREKLASLVSRIEGGTGSAGNLAKEYERLKNGLTTQREKLDEAKQRAENAKAAYNQWVNQYNSEAGSGRVSSSTESKLKRAESDMKSAINYSNGQVDKWNRDIERMKEMEKNFDSGQDRMDKSAEDLVAAMREADQATVRVCEAERRAGIVVAEAGAPAASAEESGLSVEEAAVRWCSGADLAGDRAKFAGQRIAFEGRIGGFDAVARRLRTFVGNDPDPSRWDHELPVSVLAGIEPPAEGIVVLEGTVSAATPPVIEVDRVVALQTK